jgi:predicted HTH domain antitoxin
MMTAVSVELPDEAFSALRQTPHEFVHSMRLSASIHWYSRGEISQENAAMIAGISREDFLMSLAAQRIDAFAVNVEDLRGELSRA